MAPNPFTELAIVLSGRVDTLGIDACKRILRWHDDSCIPAGILPYTGNVAGSVLPRAQRAYVRGNALAMQPAGAGDATLIRFARVRESIVALRARVAAHDSYLRQAAIKREDTARETRLAPRVEGPTWCKFAPSSFTSVRSDDLEAQREVARVTCARDFHENDSLDRLARAGVRSIDGIGIDKSGKPRMARIYIECAQGKYFARYTLLRANGAERKRG